MPAADRFQHEGEGGVLVGQHLRQRVHHEGEFVSHRSVFSANCAIKFVERAGRDAERGERRGLAAQPPPTQSRGEETGRAHCRQFLVREVALRPAEQQRRARAGLAQ